MRLGVGSQFSWAGCVMSSTPWWVPLLVGLVGLVGSGLGAAGAIWSQRVAADRADQRETLERQSEAVIRMLSAAQGFDDGAQVLQLVLRNRSLHGRLDSYYEQYYLERWKLLVDAFAGVAIQCPRVVAEEAGALSSALRALSDRTDAWYQAIRAGRLGSTSWYGPRWAKDRAAVDTPHEHFINAARRAFPDLEDLDLGKLYLRESQTASMREDSEDSDLGPLESEGR